MNDITSIIGAISGCLSLLAIVYLFGFWRGKVDSTQSEFRERLKEIREVFKNYPPAEMWTMLKTLWDIYVVEALHHRPDLAEHGSGFKLKREGEDLIPDYIKPLLDHNPPNPFNSEAVATGYLVVKLIGMELIGRMAAEKGLSLQESIAILSTYLDEKLAKP